MRATHVADRPSHGPSPGPARPPVSIEANAIVDDYGWLQHGANAPTSIEVTTIVDDYGWLLQVVIVHYAHYTVRAVCPA